MLPVATLLLLAAALHLEEPFDAAEIRELAASGDAWVVPELERAFDRRWRQLARFPAGLAPAGLEEEIVATLAALSELEPDAAARMGRVVLSAETSSSLRWAAREAVAAAGDLDFIRAELLSYFEDPRRSRDVLARAALATDDLRLRDFRPEATAAHGAATLSSRVERNLACIEENGAVRALLAGGAPPRVLGAAPSSALDARIARSLRRSLADGSEDEAVDALAALAGRGALLEKDVRPLLDDPRSRVRALAARFSNDASELRRRLEGADDPFAAEALRSILRVAGVEGASELVRYAEGRGFRAALALFDALDAPLVERLVRALGDHDRVRALRVLAERDGPLLARLVLEGSDVDALHPYLATSSRREVRRKLTRARDARGAALASGLLSAEASLREKRELLEAMSDAWSGALVAGGEPTAEALSRLLSEEELERFIESEPIDDAFVAALGFVPSPLARARLEAIGSSGAVRSLSRRSDRVLAAPALARLRASADPRVREQAELALVRLGAAGATAFVRAELATDPESVSMIAAAMLAPLEPRLMQDLVEPLAGSDAASPDGLAALFLYHERHPVHFLTLASRRAGALADRVSFVMALSAEPKRIPLLVDLATSEIDDSRREASLLGLAERELGSFEKRLHRLAGHYERRMRFLAAAALVPSGEPWSLRLLVAELDPSDPFEARRAARALDRLAPERARALLEALVEDGTAGAFAIGALLDRNGDALRTDARFQRRAWELLTEDVERGDALAIETASRLANEDAIAAVLERLPEL